MPSLKEGNEVAATDNQKAEMLAETLEKAHDTDSAKDTDEQKAINNTTKRINSESYPISKRLLTGYLTTPQEFSNDIAPGTDNITYKLIENLSNKAFAHLTYIVNSVLKLQHYPRASKTAVVPKTEKIRPFPENYRPISLLSGDSKLTEKILLERLNPYDKQLKFTPACQLKNTVWHTRSWEFINDIKTHFNSERFVTLDMQKAFDRV